MKSFFSKGKDMGTVYDRDLAEDYAARYQILKHDGEELWIFRVRIARFLEANKQYSDAHAVLFNQPPEDFKWERAMPLERGNDDTFVNELARRVEALLARYRREQAHRVRKQQRGFLFTKALLRWMIAAVRKSGKNKEDASSLDL